MRGLLDNQTQKIQILDKMNVLIHLFISILSAEDILIILSSENVSLTFMTLLLLASLLFSLWLQDVAWRNVVLALRHVVLFWRHVLSVLRHGVLVVDNNKAASGSICET